MPDYNYGIFKLTNCLVVKNVFTLSCPFLQSDSLLQVNIILYLNLPSLFLRSSYCNAKSTIVARDQSVQFPGEGLLPYMGYIGMCSLKKYQYSSVLVIDRLSI